MLLPEINTCPIVALLETIGTENLTPSLFTVILRIPLTKNCMPPVSLIVSLYILPLIIALNVNALESNQSFASPADVKISTGPFTRIFLSAVSVSENDTLPVTVWEATVGSNNSAYLPKKASFKRLHAPLVEKVIYPGCTPFTGLGIVFESATP